MRIRAGCDKAFACAAKVLSLLSCCSVVLKETWQVLLHLSFISRSLYLIVELRLSVRGKEWLCKAI